LVASCVDNTNSDSYLVITDETHEHGNEYNLRDNEL